jgi:hypothetical protein
MRIWIRHSGSDAVFPLIGATFLSLKPVRRRTTYSCLISAPYVSAATGIRWFVDE